MIPFIAGAQTESVDTAIYMGEDASPATDEDTLAGPVNDYSENYKQSSNTAAPSQDEWNKLTNDKDFGYKHEREYTVQPAPKQEETPGWIKAIAKFFEFFTTTAGHVVLWGILALIIGFIIYRLVIGGNGLFSRNKKVGQTTNEEEISEDDLLESDWEQRLRAALSAGDNRLAIRYSYLLLLQLLQRRTFINYRQDKTNTDYYRELANTAERLRPDFRNITRQYEWAWYGAFVGTKEEVDTYFQNFNRLKAAIA